MSNNRTGAYGDTVFGWSLLIAAVVALGIFVGFDLSHDIFDRPWYQWLSVPSSNLSTLLIIEWSALLSVSRWKTRPIAAHFPAARTAWWTGIFMILLVAFNVWIVIGDPRTSGEPLIFFADGLLAIAGMLGAIRLIVTAPSKPVPPSNDR
jgi:hypothetical protein